MTIRIIDHVMKSRQNTEIPYTFLEVRTRVYLEVSPRRGIYLAPVYFLWLTRILSTMQWTWTSISMHQYVTLHLSKQVFTLLPCLYHCERQNWFSKMLAVTLYWWPPTRMSNPESQSLLYRRQHLLEPIESRLKISLSQLLGYWTFIPGSARNKNF